RGYLHQLPFLHVWSACWRHTPFLWDHSTCCVPVFCFWGFLSAVSISSVLPLWKVWTRDLCRRQPPAYCSAVLWQLSSGQNWPIRAGTYSLRNLSVLSSC